VITCGEPGSLCSNLSGQSFKITNKYPLLCFSFALFWFFALSLLIYKCLPVKGIENRKGTFRCHPCFFLEHPVLATEFSTVLLAVCVPKHFFNRNGTFRCHPCFFLEHPVLATEFSTVLLAMCVSKHFFLIKDLKT